MPKERTQLFKEFSVWRRIDDETLLRYRCLQVPPDGGYCVKSSHFYRYPLSLDDGQIAQAKFYFMDSLFQDSLSEAVKETYGTLEEAITKHDKDFDYFFEDNSFT
jgi:hypothetical protein